MNCRQLVYIELLTDLDRACGPWCLSLRYETPEGEKGSSYFKPDGENLVIVDRVGDLADSLIDGAVLAAFEAVAAINEMLISQQQKPWRWWLAAVGTPGHVVDIGSLNPEDHADLIGVDTRPHDN